MRRPRLWLALLAALAWAPGANAEVPLDALAGYWCFEGDVRDESGAGNDGLASGVGFPAGRQGLAVGFDDPGDSLQVPSAPELDFGPGDFSVAVWVWRDAAQSPETLVARSAPGCFETGWELSVEGAGVASFRRRVASCQLPAEGGAVGVGAWHQVVGVRRGNWDELYVDGQLVDVATGPAGSPDTAAPLALGVGLAGRLDELGIWGRALSTAEIDGLYAGGSGVSLCTPAAVPASGAAWRLLLGTLLAAGAGLWLRRAPSGAARR